MSYTELLGLVNLRPFGRLFGAEGEDDPGEGQEPPVDDPVKDGDPKAEPKTYDEAYVKELRAENAKRRTEAKTQADELEKLKAKVAEAERAEMNDLDKAKSMLDEVTKKATEAEARALASEAKYIASQVELAVTLEAGALGFNDPGDALSMIDQDGLIDDAGEVNTKTVKARLKALAESKPYLIKQGKGSGDGAPKPNAPKNESREDRRKRFHKQLIESGKRV